MVRKLLGAAIVLAISLALVGCAQAGGTGPADTSAQDSSSNAAAGTSAQVENASSAADEAASDLRSYTVARIDGNIDASADIDWSGIAQLDIDNAQWLDAYGILAHAQLCYDDEALYVHMWAEEQDIRAEHSKDELCPSCYEDSCLEFFITPVGGDARYMNFEFNPNCAVCSEIGTHKEDRVALVPRDDIYNASSALTDDGWEIFYEVPFDYLRNFFPGFEVQSGSQVRANFYKCGNLTANKHYLSWNPIDSDTPNFHMPESFGLLIFG